MLNTQNKNVEDNGILTVSASINRVGHSAQDVSMCDDLTNFDPIPRKLLPR